MSRFTKKKLHECTTSPQVLIHGRINETQTKLRITIIQEILFHNSDIDGVENIIFVILDPKVQKNT